MDASQVFPINIVQGATLIRQITYYDTNGNPVNLTGYTADMQFRSTVQDTGSPIIDLSTANGGISINALAGTITFTISSTISAILSDGQQMVYNLFLTSGTGVVTPLLSGPSYVQGSTIR
jgi:hypothetical protein